MKKTILSLIAAILLCTMCMGFVACYDDPPTPEPSGINLYDFAKETEFSFGRLEEGEIIGSLRRAIYGERYNEENAEATASANDPGYSNKRALLLKNDVQFENTIDTLQSLVNVFLMDNLNEGVYSLDEINSQGLIDFAERKKVAFYGESYKRQNSVAQNNIDKRKKLIKKIEDENSIYAYYVFNDPMPSCNSANVKHYEDSALEFQIERIVKKQNISISLSARIELFMYYDEMQFPDLAQYYVWGVFDALISATDNELYELGKQYYEIMKEMIDTWLNDPRGQAYLNEYNP